MATPRAVAGGRSAAGPPGPGRIPIPVRYAGLVLAWGLNYVVVRWGLGFAAPIWLAAGRAVVGALCVALFLAATPARRGHLDRAGRRDAILLGLPTTTVFFGLWFAAATQILPGEAAVLVYTFPLWVTVLAVPLQGDRPRPLALAALAVGFAGVVLVSQPWAAGGPLPVLPTVALLVGAVSWAIGTVLFQSRFRAHEMQEANLYQLAGGSAGLLLAALLFEPSLPVPSVPLAAAVLWLGAVGTAFGYATWYGLLAELPAPTLSAYLFLVPLVALVVSVAVFAEALTAVQAVGVIAVGASIYGTARGRRPG